MNDIDLSAVDLNLMKSFEALERGRSATKAGQLLGVGQPAMSHALARLRELFMDELFIRGGAGLEPTPRALALIGPIRAALGIIDTTLRGDRTFKPETAAATVRLAMSDVGVVSLLPPLLNLLRAEAPGLDVVVHPATPDSLPDDLDRGYVALASGVFPVSSPWHRSERLYDDDFLCVFNPALLDVGPEMTLERFVAERHLLVSRRGDRVGVVDETLRTLGLQRRVAAVVPYFLAAAHALLDAPLVATFPRRFAEHCCIRHGLAAVPLPFPSPRYAVSLVWHGQNDQDLLHIWLRAAFRRAAAG